MIMTTNIAQQSPDLIKILSQNTTQGQTVCCIFVLNIQCNNVLNNIRQNNVISRNSSFVNLPIRTNQGFHLKFLEYNSSPDLNKIDYFSELCGNFSQISQNWTSLSKDAKKMLKFRTILIYLKETAEFCKFGILWNAFLIIRSTSLLN